MLLAPDPEHLPPGFAELEATEVREILSGKRVHTDTGIRQMALDFGESFYPDGRWQSSRAERGPVMLFGRWTVTDGRVCVTLERASPAWGHRTPHDCRRVWLNRSSGRLLMADRERPGRLVILIVRPIATPGARM